MAYYFQPSCSAIGRHWVGLSNRFWGVCSQPIGTHAAEAQGGSQQRVIERSLLKSGTRRALAAQWEYLRRSPCSLLSFTFASARCTGVRSTTKALYANFIENLSICKHAVFNLIKLKNYTFWKLFYIVFCVIVLCRVNHFLFGKFCVRWHGSRVVQLLIAVKNCHFTFCNDSTRSRVNWSITTLFTGMCIKIALLFCKYLQNMGKRFNNLNFHLILFHVIQNNNMRWSRS